MGRKTGLVEGWGSCYGLFIGGPGAAFRVSRGWHYVTISIT